MRPLLRSKPRIVHFETSRIEAAQQFVLRCRPGQLITEEILAGLQLALIEIRIGSLRACKRALGEQRLARSVSASTYSGKSCKVAGSKSAPLGHTKV